MSETQEGYGAQSTPDMGESYPPQTGDLLRAPWLARTVVELDAERKSKSEEPSAYQRSLEARVRELEAASTEPSAYQRSLEARIERLEAMMSDPEHEPICRDCGQPEHMDGCDAQPEPTAEPAVTTPTATREDCTRKVSPLHWWAVRFAVQLQGIQTCRHGGVGGNGGSRSFILSPGAVYLHDYETYYLLFWRRGLDGSLPLGEGEPVGVRHCVLRHGLGTPDDLRLYPIHQREGA